MARPRTITDRQLLDAARDVFLDKGYSATTAEIARHAGVSEGTIFRRFPSKERLFLASMGLEQQPAWFALIDEVEEHGDLHDNLKAIAQAMYAFFKNHVPRIVGLMNSPLETFELFCKNEDAEPLPVRGIRKLASFFAEEKAKGRVAEHIDPLIVARLMAGSLHFHCFSEYAGFADRLGGSGEEVVDAIVSHVYHLVRAE